MKPDGQLQDEVIAALKANLQSLSTCVGVAVKQGVVELSGEVRSQGEKLAVEHIVQSVPGVKALAVELDVTALGHAQVSDLEIARCAEIGLNCRDGVQPHALKVVVEGGIVTLAGDAESSAKKQAALDSLRYLRGVVGVVDEIAVRPTVTHAAVRTDIETALHRLAITEVAKILISVEGDEVTLTGSVRNLTVGETVIRSVGQTRGVRHVVDKLSIEGQTT